MRESLVRRLRGGRKRHVWRPYRPVSPWWRSLCDRHLSKPDYLHPDEPDRPLCRECERRMRKESADA